MRRAAPTLLILLAALALTGATDEGCGTTTTEDQPDKGTTNAAPAPKPEKKKPEKKARIGDAITVEGSDVKLQVTVLDVIDPVSAGEFDEPSSGKRYVGVQVQIRNIGDSTYSDSPSNGAQVITNTDEQASSTLLSGGDCGSDFASSAKISPGAKQQGCLPFEIDEDQKPKLFQFTANSGFAPNTAEWRLR